MAFAQTLADHPHIVLGQPTRDDDEVHWPEYYLEHHAGIPAEEKHVTIPRIQRVHDAILHDLPHLGDRPLSYVRQKKMDERVSSEGGHRRAHAPPAPHEAVTGVAFEGTSLEAQFTLVKVERAEVVAPKSTGTRSAPLTATDRAVKSMVSKAISEKRSSAAEEVLREQQTLSEKLIGAPRSEPNRPASGRLMGTPVASIRYDEALEQPEPKPDPPSFFDKVGETIEGLLTTPQTAEAMEHAMEMLSFRHGHAGLPKKPQPKSHSSRPASKKDAGVRKHLVRCRLEGGKLHYWKAQAVQLGRDEVANGDVLANPCRGIIVLDGSSTVQIRGSGMEMVITTVAFSGDGNDAQAFKHVFLCPPPHVDTQLPLPEIQERIHEQVQGQRTGFSHVAHFRQDPLKAGFMAAPWEPPLSSKEPLSRMNTRMHPSYEGLRALSNQHGEKAVWGPSVGELLDGYIPQKQLDEDQSHTQVRSMKGRTLTVEASEAASRFHQSQLKLEDALHIMRRTRAGSDKAAHSIAMISGVTRMDDVPTRFLTGDDGTSVHASRKAPRISKKKKTPEETLVQMEGGEFSRTRSMRAILAAQHAEEDAEDGEEEEEEEEDMDTLEMTAFAEKYLEPTPPTQKWDVEEGSGCIVLRHVRYGIMVVLSSAEPPLVKLVSSYGKVVSLTREGGMEDATLSPENRQVIQRFSSRFLSTAETRISDPSAPTSINSGKPLASTTSGEAGWDVAFDWKSPRTMGGWSLSSSRENRCVALHTSDPGGGVHLFGNGILFIGSSAAILHLQTPVGPIGPTSLPTSKAVPLLTFGNADGACDEAAAGLVVWRAQLGKLAQPAHDISLLSVDQINLLKGVSMQPLHLTVTKGFPPFDWDVSPPLPRGLHLVKVDDRSAQIVGVPLQITEEHINGPYGLEIPAESFAVTVSNRLGSEIHHVGILVLGLPRNLVYEPEVVVCSAGVRVDCAPASITHGELCRYSFLQGKLPRGMRLDALSGKIGGAMVDQDDPVFDGSGEVMLIIQAANPMSSTEAMVILRLDGRASDAVTLHCDQEKLIRRSLAMAPIEVGGLAAQGSIEDKPRDKPEDDKRKKFVRGGHGHETTPKNVVEESGDDLWGRVTSAAQPAGDTGGRYIKLQGSGLVVELPPDEQQPQMPTRAMAPKPAQDELQSKSRILRTKP